jgi:hypothetical protein
MSPGASSTRLSAPCVSSTASRSAGPSNCRTSPTASAPRPSPVSSAPRKSRASSRLPPPAATACCCKSPTAAGCAWASCSPCRSVTSTAPAWSFTSARARDARTASCRCRYGCSKNCAPTGVCAGHEHGCFPARSPISPLAGAMCNATSAVSPGIPASASTARCTRCAIMPNADLCRLDSQGGTSAGESGKIFAA